MTLAYNPTPINFGALADMGQNLGGALGQHNLGSAMQGTVNPDGTYNFDKMISVLAGRNPMAATALAARKAETDADNEYRRGMLEIAQHKASQPMPGRIVNLPDKNGVLQPFERSSDGQITPVQAPGVGQRYKPMGVNDITKLSEEGGKASSVAEFSKTFSDDYGGYGGGFETIAQVKMLMGRTGWADPKLAESATWWQGYDKYKNVVRNDLFGSALTPSEQAQFEKADITPGMDPKIIRSNLALQNRLIQTGLARKTAAFKAQGYNPAVIDKAYGVNQSTDAPAVNSVKTVPLGPDGQPVQAPPPETPELQAEMGGGGYGKQPKQATPDDLAKLKAAIAKAPHQQEAIEKAFDRYIGAEGSADFYLRGSR
jgi:hypothetical protein